MGGISGTQHGMLLLLCPLVGLASLGPWFLDPTLGLLLLLLLDGGLDHGFQGLGPPPPLLLLIIPPLLLLLLIIPPLLILGLPLWVRGHSLKMGVCGFPRH
jgi:hypothetical protein